MRCWAVPTSHPSSSPFLGSWCDPDCSSLQQPRLQKQPREATLDNPASLSVRWLALSGSRGRGNMSCLESWLWLPSLGLPLPTICRQGSQQSHHSPLEACLLPHGGSWIQILPVHVDWSLAEECSPFLKWRINKRSPPSRWRLCCWCCHRAAAEHQANPPNSLLKPRI